MNNFGRKISSGIIFKEQKGISLYLAVVVISILLAISLGLTAILVGQIKTARSTGYSVVAFYAAETGIELGLNTSTCDSDCSLSGSFTVNGKTASYTVLGLDSGTGICTGTACVSCNYCLQSIGDYQQTKRSILISK
jgi:hypothetical protein